VPAFLGAQATVTLVIASFVVYWYYGRDD
jgi:hypothetical protein